MARRILVPMDDSPPARAALKHALGEFTDTDVTVVVLHVFNPVEATYGADPLGGDMDFYENWRERAEQRADRVFGEARSLADEHGVELETVTATGPPARVIVEHAEENEIDQIVIGSHGRSGVSRLLLGSVAETVVRRSPVPVTVVR